MPTPDRIVRCAAGTAFQRANARYEERWLGPDDGLLTCWEAGRQLSKQSPQLAQAARAGELPILPFRGGLDKPVKDKKYGRLEYLAMWQGLRDNDLLIDRDAETPIQCARHGTVVIFRDEPAPDA